MNLFNKIYEEINELSFYYKLICVSLLIFGAVSLIATIELNFTKTNLVSTHYLNWYEQLPADDPIKKADYTIFTLLKTKTDLALLAGIILNTSEEILKYEFSEADITNLGMLEVYLENEFSKVKPEFIILNDVNSESLKKITLEQGQTKSIKLFRNAEELSFNDRTLKNLPRNSDVVNLKEIISLDFVKAYVENKDIARIEGNKIKTISKGETKLRLIYKTELLDIDVIVK